MMIPLDPDFLHGGVAVVMLPEPPAGHRWRVEWRVVGTDDWQEAASELEPGGQPVPLTAPPEPQHRLEWRAVTAVAGGGPACTICGAAGAVPQGYSDPDLGPVALCPRHRDRGLDWS